MPAPLKDVELAPVPHGAPGAPVLSEHTTLNLSDLAQGPGVANAAIILQFKGEAQVDYLKKTVAPACARAGLSIRAFVGAPMPTPPPGHKALDPPAVYAIVEAPEERLLTEAERLKFKLQLDSRVLREADRAENQRLANEGVSFNPDGGDNEAVKDLAIPTQPPGRCCGSRNPPLDPYQYIWAPYCSAPHAQALYRRTEKGGLLNGMQALKLLLSVLESPADDTEGGAGLSLDKLVVNKRIGKWYPAHDPVEQAKLAREWIRCIMMPWRSPTTSIKNYFGEKVGMYFAFLTFLTRWLIPAALLGTGIFIHQCVAGTPYVSYLPVLALVVALWSTLLIEAWKRESSLFAVKWGTDDYKSSEPLRPQFIANMRTKRARSWVTGKPTFNAAPAKNRLRLTCSFTATGTLLGSVVVIVIGIFWLRVVLINTRKLPEGFPDYISTIVNAVQIAVMNAVYRFMARKLTEWENHPTQSAHESSLTIKLAVFYTLNAFIGLVYIAGFKNFVTIDGLKQTCRNGDCMKELQSQLAVLFISKFVISNLQEVVVPWLKSHVFGPCCRRIRYRKHPEYLETVERALAARAAVEKEASLGAWDIFDDYLELLIIFGYVTLFVISFPIAPLIALISFVVELKGDSSKLMRFLVRPMPKGATDIGAWLPVFEAMSYACVVTNLTVIVFTSGTQEVLGRNMDMSERFIFFIAAEHALMIVKYFLATYIPDESYKAMLQRERAAYLVAKHIYKVPDVASTRAEEENLSFQKEWQTSMRSVAGGSGAGRSLRALRLRGGSNRRAGGGGGGGATGAAHTGVAGLTLAGGGGGGALFIAPSFADLPRSLVSTPSSAVAGAAKGAGSGAATPRAVTASDAAAGVSGEPVVVRNVLRGASGSSPAMAASPAPEPLQHSAPSSRVPTTTAAAVGYPASSSGQNTPRTMTLAETEAPPMPAPPAPAEAWSAPATGGFGTSV